MRQIELYVPTQDNQGKPIPSVDWDRLHESLIIMGGGFTAYRAEGQWRNDAKQIIGEPITVYRILTDDQYAEQNIKNLADFVKRHWRQESVLYTVQDVQATFI